jgi:hypothetical protein
LLACALFATVAVPCRADEPSATAETLIRLRVAPAPAPTPVLRYVLLPDLKELNPGNPCRDYLLSFMGRETFFFGKEQVDRRERLLAMPLKELPARDLLDYGGSSLQQADGAARLETPDWQMLIKVKTDGVAALLPDIQQLPVLADALRVRLRAEAAAGRFDAAVHTLQTLFAMARHVGEHPTIVASQWGRDIALRSLGTLEETIEQPGCPNLYWALAYLPSPLVSPLKGIDGERALSIALFRGLYEAGPMSNERLEQFIAPLDQLVSGGKPFHAGDVKAWIDRRARDEAILAAARRRLVALGLPADRVAQFPPRQVILLDEKREYEVRRDEVLALVNLPVWQTYGQLARFKPSNERALFADPLMEGLPHLGWGQARLEQRLVLLRHVEALRLHAAEHHGALPAALSEITVPLPADPFTGQPVRYELNGATAHLRSAAPPGEEKEPYYNVHYEVSLKDG